MEFKQSYPLKKSEMENMVAAIEYLFPHVRGQLPWSKAVLKGWAVQHKPRHIVPMGRSHTSLWAAYLVSFGAVRMGVGVMLQRELGLRPSELLGLRASDIAPPESQHRPASKRAVFGLGLRR